MDLGSSISPNKTLFSVLSCCCYKPVISITFILCSKKTQYTVFCHSCCQPSVILYQFHSRRSCQLFHTTLISACTYHYFLHHSSQLPNSIQSPTADCFNYLLFSFSLLMQSAVFPSVLHSSLFSNILYLLLKVVEIK
jgi:hypothetical protein